VTTPKAHRLVNDTLVAEAGGIVGRCVCGWSTGPRFTSMVASSLFRDHVDHPKKPEPPSLYDVAREVCHEHGMAWTDPRTGERHDPPKDAMQQFGGNEDEH
jgi:hypothetical protein